MELILLIAPLPLGFFLRSRVAAFLTYVAMHSFVFTFQSTTLTLAWVAGSDAAFERSGAAPWPYLVVNAVIYGWLAARGCGRGERFGGRRRWTSPPARRAPR